MSSQSSGSVTGFFHVGLTVADTEEALRFYRDALGLRVVASDDRPGPSVSPVVGVEPERVLVTWLEVPGSDAQIEMFEYQGIERESAAARPCDIGYGHFCLYVDDLDGVYDRLRERGFSSIRPPYVVTDGLHAGAKAVYATSPDGYNVELYQRASA